MKRFLLLMCLAISVLAINLFIGCSSSGTDPVTKETGDLNDPEFQQIMGVTGESGEFTGMMFDYLGGMIDSVLSHPDNPNAVSSKMNNNAFASADSIMFTFHSESGYWYLYFASADTIFGDFGHFEVISLDIEDSIKFYHGTAGVQWPDSALLTKVHNGAFFEFGFGSNLHMGTFWDVTVEGEDIFTIGDIVVNGTNGAAIAMNDSEGCSINANLNGTISNIAINILAEDDCPSSGFIRQVGNIELSCTGDTTYSYNDSWMILETFNNGVIDVVFENSTTRWTFTDTCGSQQAVSPYDKFAELAY